MLVALKNKQKMLYSLQIEAVDIYERDNEGNILYYEDSEGNKLPYYKTQKTITYTNPVEFYSNISTSGGDAEATEFGLDRSDYSAVICDLKGVLPLDDKSIVWLNSEPKFDENGAVKPESADYKVIAVRPTLNFVKYVLKEVVKSGS